jgi:hypothetical protein
MTRTKNKLMKILAGAFATTFILVFSAGATLASPKDVPLSSEFDGFPLWKDVPGRTFAKLGEAKLPDGTRWAAYVSRVGAGRRGRENPVLTVARITAIPGFGQYNKSTASGPLTPDGEGDPPVTAMFTESSSFAAHGGDETFLAMSFKPSIASILITPVKGEAIRKRTHLLNRFQRRKTHLPTLRYVALGLEREVCIANLVGYGTDGEVPYKECKPSPPISE